MRQRRRKSDDVCTVCGGEGVVSRKVWEPRSVRVATSETTVVEEVKLRAVVLREPCECVGGIRTMLVGHTHLDG